LFKPVEIEYAAMVYAPIFEKMSQSPASSRGKRARDMMQLKLSQVGPQTLSNCVTVRHCVVVQNTIERAIGTIIQIVEITSLVILRFFCDALCRHRLSADDVATESVRRGCKEPSRLGYDLDGL
jgi:hypothetical protein